MRTTLAATLLLASPLTLLLAQAPAPPGPAATINLGTRQARVTPHRAGFTHTGGGNIDVQQPAADTLVITMSGVAVAGGHPCKDSLSTLHFDLTQCLEIAFEKKDLKKANLTIEGRLIGLLRSHGRGCGTASVGPAQATVSAGGVALTTLAMPGHSVGGGDSISLNDREGPVTVEVVPGKFTLHQTFAVSASHPHTLKLTKAASAEFAPDPALDPLWISYWEPFHGAAKKDFGLQVTVKVAP